MGYRKLLFIPGAQKSGSTSLWKMLLQHKKIHPLQHPHARGKENHFFTLNPKIAKDNLQWYLSMLGEEDGWYVDASMSHMVAPYAPKMISTLPFTAKCLFVLRDPASRAFSAYLHMRTKTPSPERRSFAKIVNFVQDCTNKSVREAESQLIQKSLDNGSIDPNYLHSYLSNLPVGSCSLELDKYFQDYLWCYKYLYYSQYSKWISLYKKHGLDVCIISMHDLINKTEKTSQKICSFLDTDGNDLKLSENNKTFHSPYWLRRLISLAKVLSPVEGTGLWAQARSLLPSSLSSTAADLREKNEDTLHELRTLLSDEYEYWANKDSSVLKM